MIDLRIRNYCNQGCTEFEPECQEYIINNPNFVKNNVIITCVHADRCEAMIRHLSQVERLDKRISDLGLTDKED